MAKLALGSRRMPLDERSSLNFTFQTAAKYKFTTRCWDRERIYLVMNPAVFGYECWSIRSSLTKKTEDTMMWQGPSTCSIYTMENTTYRWPQSHALHCTSNWMSWACSLGQLLAKNTRSKSYDKLAAFLSLHKAKNGLLRLIDWSDMRA